MTWDDLVEGAIKRGVDPDAPVIVVIPHVGEATITDVSAQSDAVLIHATLVER